MNRKRGLWVAVSCLLLASWLGAQGTSSETGGIRGVVKDEQGNALPGVNITVSSPAQMGTTSATTNVDGAFRLTLLPIGTYSLVAELPGFQTVKRDGLIVRLGATITVNLAMPAATIQEQVNVVAVSPLVDVKTSKSSQTLNLELLQNIPVARDVFAAVALTPGTVYGEITPARTAAYTTSIKGSGVANNILAVDGFYANDVDNSLPQGTKFDFNVLQEVEVVTGGMPAEIGTTSGGFINIVTKAGGNAFTGVLQGFYDSQDFSTIVLPEEQLRAMGLGKPAVAVFAYDLSGSLGGPVIKDKMWFFVNGRYYQDKRGSGFKPWTDPTGVFHGDYDLLSHAPEGYLKLSYQPMKALRISLTGNMRWEFNNSAQSGLYNPIEASSYRDPWRYFSILPVVTWIPNPNMIVEARVGYLGNDMYFPTYHPELPYNRDRYTGYTFGSTERELWTGRPGKQASLHVTRFQDNLLGGDHEIKAGVEWAYGAREDTIWKKEPLQWWWYNGSPYYYRGLYNLTGPHPLYGDGYIGLYVAGVDRAGAAGDIVHTNRLGAYIQDSVTIKNRLTINLGFRFDKTTASYPEIHKGRSGGIAVAVGDAVFKSTYGFNPYEEYRQPGVDDLINWSIINPRLGVTYDVFGDGKTAVKVNIGRYSDWLPGMTLGSAHPLYYKYYYFYWTDLNNNGVPDAPPLDSYKSDPSTSPLEMLPSFWRQKISKGIKSPYDDQLLVGINHEILPNFRLGLSYQYKKKSGIMDDALINTANGQFWYKPNSGYWVPFTTTVPALDIFPAQTLTMYFPRADAPSNFYSLTNLSEAYRKYSGVEFTFEKRMSNGWQLGGSVSISKSWGNYSGDYGGAAGAQSAGNSANWLVNNAGRLPEDKPLIMKLYGTFNIPYGLVASFYYNYYDGAPWARTVTVTPPSAWATANGVNTLLTYTVNTEQPGARRYYTYQNCDFRLEKRFGLGKLGSVGVFVDVFNLLGHNFVNVTQNPAGTWRPTDNNVTTGTYTVTGTYKAVTSVTNLSRVFRLSVRYTF